MNEPTEFRPRLPHDPALIRLAGLHRRTPTREVIEAIDQWKIRNAKLLREGPKRKEKA